MDDEELAESVAKRKQAEEHGYVAPALVNTRTKSKFGDGLTIPNDDDEDDFFSLTKKPANGEDEDFGDEAAGGSGTKTPKEGAPKKKSSAKRKAQDGE
jgi:DNA helicase INO80